MAKNDIVVFLEPDIPNFEEDIVGKLTAPLIRDEADFVKSYFERPGAAWRRYSPNRCWSSFSLIC